jgi:hypothetical protein
MKDHPRKHGIAAHPTLGTDLNAGVLRAWAHTATLWKTEGDPSVMAPSPRPFRLHRRQVEPG